MNNVRFALVIGALVVITLGVIGLRYNVEASPVIHPVVVVYRDKTIRQGQSLPPGDRVWTLAVRSDGSLMQAEGMPDATEHISTAKSIEFKDRYVVIDPHTMSTSTYKPYKPIVVPTRDCLARIIHIFEDNKGLLCYKHGERFTNHRLMTRGRTAEGCDSS
jgi:hypothetical protein